MASQREELDTEADWAATLCLQERVTAAVLMEMTPNVAVMLVGSVDLFASSSSPEPTAVIRYYVVYVHSVHFARAQRPLGSPLVFLGKGA